MRHKMYRRTHQLGLQQGLIRSILTHGRVVTTLDRAKYIKPFVEKLITSARKANATGSLASHRLLRSKVNEPVYRNLLDFAKKVNPNGGYTRIIKLSQPMRGNLVRKAVISVIVNPISTERASN